MKNEIWRPLAEMRKEPLWYSVVVRDRHGKVVSRERRKSHSLLKQWNQVMWAQMTTGNIQVTQTSGVANSVSDREYNFTMVAGGTSIAGIVVGTGTTPVAIDDYALETQIVHGTGAGEMSHGACTVATSVVAAPSCSFLVSRTITNNSPGVITVREAAIYMRCYDPPRYICAARDVLVAPQAVPIGGSITIDWTIGVTV